MSEIAAKAANDLLKQQIENRLLLQDQGWLSRELETKNHKQIAEELGVDPHLVAQRHYQLAMRGDEYSKPDYMIEDKLRALAMEYSDREIAEMYSVGRERICYWRRKWEIAPFLKSSVLNKAPHVYTATPTLPEMRYWGCCKKCYWTAEIVLVQMGRRHWQLEKNQKLQPEEDGTITHVGCGGTMRLSR